jgi:hypothetical protein
LYTQLRDTMALFALCNSFVVKATGYGDLPLRFKTNGALEYLLYEFVIPAVPASFMIRLPR